MSEKLTAFPSVGGIEVEVTEDAVTLEQEDLSGNGASSVWIPRGLLREVLSTVFSCLHPWELREIAELAETHATPPKA